MSVFSCDGGKTMIIEVLAVICNAVEPSLSRFRNFSSSGFFIEMLIAFCNSLRFKLGEIKLMHQVALNLIPLTFLQ